jgi:FAD/FMN-containing dehydrogenase
VAVVTGPGDVAACVTWARKRGHQVLVQATGHGFAGTAGPGVLMIDTSDLNRVDIDGSRARVGAGAQWGAVSAAAEPHRMLGLPGTALDVGVVGYTVHGGIGWLTRRHGLASGRLTAVEFIDGTGAARRADENSDPELLWAFRGGGGLGIVTAAGFELVPAGDLHAGFMLWPAGAASEVIGASIWPWPAARGRPRHRPCPAPCLRSPRRRRTLSAPATQHDSAPFTSTLPPRSRRQARACAQ